MAILHVATIRLTVTQRRQLYAIRRRASPHEAAALLLGTFNKNLGMALVHRVVEMENIARSTSTFELDPEQQYCVLTAAAKENLEQVGIFHSHPAPPKPSGWDLEYMRFNPCVWIIDGIQGLRHRMKAYQLIEGQLYPVEIQSTLQ